MSSRSAIVLLLVAGLAQAATPVAASETPVTLMVLGETHGTRPVTHSLVDLAVAKGAVGCVCPGDFIYGHSDATPQGWRSMMAPVMGTMMPAQGNHDWPWSDWQSMFPGGKPYYAMDVNGAQFIALNPEHSSLSAGSTQRVWLEARLAERDPSAMKVLFMHRPWWLPQGAVHPSSEFESKAGTSAATMFALMEKHGVDLVVSAHERNYQHSVHGGVHYLVAGGGGNAFYTLGYEYPEAVLRLKKNIVSTLDVTPTSLTLRSYEVTGPKIEEFTITSSGSPKPDPAPAPAAWRPRAEDFPTKTTGGLARRADFEGGQGWNLWANGHLEQAAGVAHADAELVVRAAGEPLAGVWPVMVVARGGTEVGRVTVDGSTRDHVFPLGAVRSTDTVRISFVNDARSSTEDRNLLLDTASIRARTAPETPSGPASIAFAHKGGNEWWAQVRLSGADAASVQSVEARAADGSWKALTLRSWGDWAGTVRMGATTQFRATLPDGRTVASCEFTHPAGEERCSSFAATFRNVRGNVWWVETDVEASGAALAGVEARVDGGSWRALEATSWGSWARSMRAPQGSTVEFRATAADGTTATSGAYAWPP